VGLAYCRRGSCAVVSSENVFFTGAWWHHSLWNMPLLRASQPKNRGEASRVPSASVEEGRETVCVLALFFLSKKATPPAE
jgi:hypothetical protein